MEILLTRYPSGETETQGVWQMEVPHAPFYTMEQECRFSPDYPAGAPGNSCVPFGLYDMVPYVRGSGVDAWCLVNKALGVFFKAADRDNDKQRFKCLVHRGAFSYHSAGCILPGMSHRMMWSKEKTKYMPAVGESRGAMEHIYNALGRGSVGHTLRIVPSTGTKYITTY